MIVVTRVDPTCTTDGYIKVTCSTCNETLSYEVIKARGHVLNDWEIIKEPTTKEEGLEVRKCSVCGEIIETEVIPIISNKFNDYTIIIAVSGALIGLGLVSALIIILKKRSKNKH